METVHQETAFNYLDFESQMLRKLAWWGTGSIFLGLLMRNSQDEMIQGIGDQVFGWGAAEWLLAMAALRNNNITRHPWQAGGDVDKKSRTMEQFLAISTGLDVLFIVGGRALGHDERPRRQGWSVGILVQALFLLFFDAFHWLSLSGKQIGGC